MRPNEPFDETLNHLIDVLDQEKDCLLAAEFDDLAELSALKERCVETIESRLSGPDKEQFVRRHASEISAMKKLASENEKLLLATKAGVKSAQERLAHLNNIDSVVGTYTATGGQLRLEGSVTTCKKIA